MIIVMGLPGAGKSTVLSALEGKGFELVNYGDLMFEIASNTAGVKSRDEMRKLDTSIQKRVQAEVAEKLSKMDGKTVLDTHCSISTIKGYLPGLPYGLLSKLNVELLVLVTAPIDDIMRRRDSDKTRIRDDEGRKSLEEHDFMNRAFLVSYSSLAGAPAAIIVNRDGKLEEAKRKLLSLAGVK